MKYRLPLLIGCVALSAAAISPPVKADIGLPGWNLSGGDCPAGVRPGTYYRKSSGLCGYCDREKGSRYRQPPPPKECKTEWIDAEQRRRDQLRYAEEDRKRAAEGARWNAIRNELDKGRTDIQGLLDKGEFVRAKEQFSMLEKKLATNDPVMKESIQNSLSGIQIQMSSGPIFWASQASKGTWDPRDMKPLLDRFEIVAKYYQSIKNRTNLEENALRSALTFSEQFKRLADPNSAIATAYRTTYDAYLRSIEAGKYQEARVHLEEISKIRSGDARYDAWLHSTVASGVGHAINNWEAVSGRGSSVEKKGDLRTALAHYDEAIRLLSEKEKTANEVQALKRLSDDKSKIEERLSVERGDAVQPAASGAARAPDTRASVQAAAINRAQGDGAPWDGRSGVTATGRTILKFEKTSDGAPVSPRPPDLASTIPGYTKEHMQRLASTQRGHEIVAEDLKLREDLQRSHEKISRIKDSLGTASDSDKKKLMEEWTAELNAQPAINTKLNQLEREAGPLAGTTPESLDWVQRTASVVQERAAGRKLIKYPVQYWGEHPPVLPAGYGQPYVKSSGRLWVWGEAESVNVYAEPAFDPKINPSTTLRVTKEVILPPRFKQILKMTVADCNAIREKEVAACVTVACVNEANAQFFKCEETARPGN